MLDRKKRSTFSEKYQYEKKDERKIGRKTI